MSTVVRGTGHYVPEHVVTNEELAPRIGTTADWIENRTGILERHYVSPGESNASLAEAAARAAIDDAGWEVDDVDALIVATLSPDAVFPGVGVYLQERLGLGSLPALDVRNQCSGFLYGLSVADGWIQSGQYDRVLLVGSEVHSTSLDFSPEGRDVTALFGDGAGAVVLESDDAVEGVVEVRLGSDGGGAEMLWCEVPSARLHPSMSTEYVEEGRHYPKMSGRAVFKRAVETLEREIVAILDDLDLEPDDVLFVPHQANRRINEMVADRVGIADDRIVHTIERYGNTTAASIPSALDIARRDGRAGPDDLLLFAAFGSGFTWGTAVVRL
jgi:3-oxoacyl-[acyl-carrier-protein] synthase-3